MRLNPFSLEEAAEAVVDRAANGLNPAFVVTPNAHHTVMLKDSSEFKNIYDRAWMVVADGVPIVWASKFLHNPLPGRVNGTDLFEEICARAAERGLSVFLFGGRPGAADGAAAVLQERNPDLTIAGTYCPPFGFEQDPVESERAIEAIRAAQPDILFVGLGAPKQEKWMAENGGRTGVPVSLGIGVSFEFVAGLVQRAPEWMQDRGLEWFHRLMMEPRRLFKRYAVTNPVFVTMVLGQLVSQARLSNSLQSA